MLVFVKPLLLFLIESLDDWGVAMLTDSGRRDLLEILDDRYGNRSTIITSQLQVEDWHTSIGDPILADAILDRLVHNAHKLNLSGDSIRKSKLDSRSVATRGLFFTPECWFSSNLFCSF